MQKDGKSILFVMLLLSALIVLALSGELGAGLIITVVFLMPALLILGIVLLFRSKPLGTNDISDENQMSQKINIPRIVGLVFLAVLIFTFIVSPVKSFRECYKKAPLYDKNSCYPKFLRNK